LISDPELLQKVKGAQASTEKCVVKATMVKQTRGGGDEASDTRDGFQNEGKSKAGGQS
jgi:hypothetical protein